MDAWFCHQVRHGSLEKMVKKERKDDHEKGGSFFVPHFSYHNPPLQIQHSVSG